MDESLDELVAINLCMPRAALDLLLDVAERRGISIDLLITEGLAAAIRGCVSRQP